MTKQSVWVDGQSDTEVPASDRGLAYGDGVFETIKVVNGQLMFESLHWQRMEDSLGRLGIAIDSVVVSGFSGSLSCGSGKVEWHSQGCSYPWQWWTGVQSGRGQTGQADFFPFTTVRITRNRFVLKALSCFPVQHGWDVTVWPVSSI